MSFFSKISESSKKEYFSYYLNNFVEFCSREILLLDFLDIKQEVSFPFISLICLFISSSIISTLGYSKSYVNCERFSYRFPIEEVTKIDNFLKVIESALMIFNFSDFICLLFSEKGLAKRDKLFRIRKNIWLLLLIAKFSLFLVYLTNLPIIKYILEQKIPFLAVNLPLTKFSEIIGLLLSLGDKGIFAGINLYNFISFSTIIFGQLLIPLIYSNTKIYSLIYYFLIKNKSEEGNGLKNNTPFITDRISLLLEEYDINRKDRLFEELYNYILGIKEQENLFKAPLTLEIKLVLAKGIITILLYFVSFYQFIRYLNKEYSYKLVTPRGTSLNYKIPIKSINHRMVYLFFEKIFLNLLCNNRITKYVVSGFIGQYLTPLILKIPLFPDIIDYSSEDTLKKFFERDTTVIFISIVFLNLLLKFFTSYRNSLTLIFSYFYSLFFSGCIIDRLEIEHVFSQYLVYERKGFCLAGLANTSSYFQKVIEDPVKDTGDILFIKLICFLFGFSNQLIEYTYTTSSIINVITTS
jgi:hypothetical protein